MKCNNKIKTSQSITFWVLIGVICLSGFFAFEIFGKTNYTLNFEIDSFKEMVIEEVAEIKISRNGSDFDTLKGKKITVDKDENVLVRLFLNEGYEPINSEGSTYYLSASGTLNEKAFCSQDGFFEWQLGNINENKDINIKGIQIKKLSVASPTIINADGEILESSKIKENWQSNLNYGEKLKFQIDLNIGEKSYSIKEIKATTKPKSKILNLNSEIKNLQNSKYEISIYDESNRFGGIKSAVNSIEILVEEVYDAEIMALAAERETTPPETPTSTLKFKSDEEPEKLGEKIEIYCSTTKDTDKSKFSGLTFDNTNKCFSTSQNTNSTIYFFIKLKEHYTNSTLTIDNLTPEEHTFTDNFKVMLYSVSLDGDKELTIKGIEANQYKVTFEGIDVVDLSSCFELHKGNSADPMPSFEDTASYGTTNLSYTVKLKDTYTFKDNNPGATFEPTDAGSSTWDSGKKELKITINKLEKDTIVTLPSVSALYNVNFKLKGEDEEKPGDEAVYKIFNRVTIFDPNNQSLDTTEDGPHQSGSTLTYKISAKKNYEFADGDVVINGGTETKIILSDDKTELTITFTINSNTTIEIPEINFKMYKLTFQDNKGSTIGTDVASITIDGLSGLINDKGTTLTSGSKIKFKIELKDGYIGPISPVAEGYRFELLNNDSDKIFEYESIESINKDTTINIYSINLQKFDVLFTCLVNSYKDYINISYKEYGENREQTGALKKISFGTAISDLVPYDHDFTFNVKVLDPRYKLSAGTVSSWLNVNNLKGHGVENVTADDDDDGSINVTLEKVTKSLSDNSISILKLESIVKNITFNIKDEEVKDKVVIYSNSSQSSDTKTEVFNLQKGINSLEAFPGKDAQISVQLLDGWAASSEGITCELSSGESETIKLNQISSDGNTYDFTVPMDELKSDGIITISGIERKKIQVSFSGFENTTIHKIINENEEEIENSSTIGVNYGEDLTLKITANNGHLIDNVQENVTVESAEGYNDITPIPQSNTEKTYIFKIPKIVYDLNVKLNLQLEKVIVDFNNSDGLIYGNAVLSESQVYTFEEEIRGAISLVYGNSYTFAVKSKAGYDLSTAKIFANGVEVESLGKKYRNYAELESGDSNIRVFRLENIKENLTITSDIKPLKCTVNLKRDSELTGKENSRDNKTYVKYYQGETEIENIEVDYGSNTEFSISLESRCNQSNAVVQIYVDDELKETINSVSGIYKIVDVKENMEVRVAGLSWNKYVLNFEKNSFAYFVTHTNGNEESLDGIRSVYYGDEFSFNIKAKPGYSLGKETIIQAVSSSGKSQELKKDSVGNYKLRDINEDYTIKIENIDNVFYTVEFTPVSGVTYYNDEGSKISGKSRVSYGKNFEFSVGIDDAYSDSLQGLHIVVNNSAYSNVRVQKLSSGRYLIQNITEDVKIKAANVSKNKYIVTLTKDEGIDYYSISNKVITGDNEVYHGESFNFRVKLAPVYTDSNIRVMLGNKELSPNDENVYSIENVQEGKTVTVVGIEKNQSSNLVDLINNLPSSVRNDVDAQEVINATRAYNALDEFQKRDIINYEVLQALQESVGELNHAYNGVVAQGLPWNIKLVANPILDNMDACSRIYEKVDNAYLLSLYDVYLVDTVTDRRYTLSDGQSVVITLPTPDMSYFERPTGIHENENGKIDYLSLNMNNDMTSLETSALSPIGIIANRSRQPGRSSLIDAVDADLSSLTNYTLDSLYSSGNNKEPVNTINSGIINSEDSEEAEDQKTDNNKFIDNSKTPVGSALKLTLILMCVAIILVIIIIILNKIKKNASKK